MRQSTKSEPLQFYKGERRVKCQFMSKGGTVTIVRMGATQKYSDGWTNAFSKKAKKAASGVNVKPAKATAKKKAKRKAKK
jgi:hypothetical protein